MSDRVANMTIFQKSACEALWRAITEHGHRYDSFPVDTSKPSARYELAQLVVLMPKHILPQICVPLIEQHGRLSGGYSMRWEGSRLQPVYREPSPHSRAMFESPPPIPEMDTLQGPS
jgi:hypothetical protein